MAHHRRQLQAWPAWGVHVSTDWPLRGLQLPLVVKPLPFRRPSHWGLLRDADAMDHLLLQLLPWLLECPNASILLLRDASVSPVLLPVQGPLGPVVSPVLILMLPGVTRSKPSLQMPSSPRFISNLNLSSEWQTHTSSCLLDLPSVSHRHNQPIHTQAAPRPVFFVSKPGSI